MKIYANELQIKDKILKDKTCSSCDFSITLGEDKPELFISSIEKGGFDKKITKSIAAVANETHPDLMYGSAILVSTTMNKNDDVFIPSETWKARFTPINTPYNDDHVECDIIGHIINAEVLDIEGNLINSEIIPNYFDIAVDFVIYKTIFPTIAKEIATKAPKNEKFVSMEASFKNFDYALFDEENKMEVIARNEETSFLTKYLRQYGGNGLYKNYRIGRVMKDFRFIGMGNVDQPANPSSKYLNVDSTNVYSKQLEKELILLNQTEGEQMDELVKANEKIEQLTQKLDTSKEDKVKSDKQVDDLTVEKTQLADKLNTESTKLTVAEQALTDKDNVNKQLQTELDGLKKKFDEASAKLAEIDKKAETEKRYAKIDELKIKLPDAQKAKIVDMTDEAFASVIEFASVITKAEQTLTEELSDVEKDAKDTLGQAKDTKDTDLSGDEQNDEDKLKSTAKLMIESIRKNRKLIAKSKI